MLVLYAGNNSQQLTLYGVSDDLGTPITGAAITGSIVQYGNTVATMSFSDLPNAPGDYFAVITFDAPLRPTTLIIDGAVPAGNQFNLQIPCVIQERTL